MQPCACLYVWWVYFFGVTYGEILFGACCRRIFNEEKDATAWCLLLLLMHAIHLFHGALPFNNPTQHVSLCMVLSGILMDATLFKNLVIICFRKASQAWFLVKRMYAGHFYLRWCYMGDFSKTMVACPV